MKRWTYLSILYFLFSIPLPPAAEVRAERRAALLLAEAQRRERLGRYADAARAYEKYRSWDSQHQADLRDRIEVLQRVTPRTDRQRLRLYLRARDFYDQDQGCCWQP